MRIIAIDPGSVSGAYAVIDLDDTAPAFFIDDLPVVQRQVDPAAFARIVRRYRPHAAVVGQVASMPRQGVASTFRFGVAFGIIQGVLAASEVPVHLVTPNVWKKAVGLPGHDDEACRAMAIRLYPGLPGLERKKDHNRASALMLARWFWKTHASDRQSHEPD